MLLLMLDMYKIVQLSQFVGCTYKDKAGDLMSLPIIYPSIGLLLQVLYMKMSTLFFSQHCNCVHFVEPLVLCFTRKDLFQKKQTAK